MTIWYYFILVYLIFMSQTVLYFLHNTSVLSLYVHIVLTLSIDSNQIVNKIRKAKHIKESIYQKWFTVIGAQFSHNSRRNINVIQLLCEWVITLMVWNWMTALKRLHNAHMISYGKEWRLGHWNMTVLNTKWKILQNRTHLKKMRKNDVHN